MGTGGTYIQPRGKEQHSAAWELMSRVCYGINTWGVRLMDQYRAQGKNQHGNHTSGMRFCEL